ncbi:MAG TPA: hypothetical protein VNX21_06580 [Candidatus Thermoplasmatota archaeon]|nr:hypothetical protein [Candidatus Thermoplasmatota archaeon]
MRASVTLAATLVTLSLVTVAIPSVSAIGGDAADFRLIKPDCPGDDEQCELCKDPTGPGTLQDKIRECTSP